MCVSDGRLDECSCGLTIYLQETTLERPPQRPPTRPSQWKDVGPQDLDDLWANWESGTFHLDPIDWELEDWDVGGYRPLGDDFDWSGVLDETGSPKG